MLSRIAPTIARNVALSRPALFAAAPQRAGFATLGEAITAGDAAELSGYSKIDFSIDEEAMVIDAVQKFAAYNIGCLVTTNSAGTFDRGIVCLGRMACHQLVGI
jgi:hypothetical protein